MVCSLQTAERGPVGESDGSSSFRLCLRSHHLHRMLLLELLFALGQMRPARKGGLIGYGYSTNTMPTFYFQKNKKKPHGTVNQKKIEPQHHASLPHTVHPNSPSPGCLLPYFFSTHPLNGKMDPPGLSHFRPSTVGPTKCVYQHRTSTMLDLAPALTCLCMLVDIVGLEFGWRQCPFVCLAIDGIYIYF